MIINVYIDLPKKAADAICNYSKELTKKFPGNTMDFDGEFLTPHITLYFADFPPGNKQKIIDAAGQVKVEPANLTFGDEKCEENYVNVRCLKGCEELDTIHRDVVKALNPLREGRQREKYTNIPSGEYSEKQMEMIALYGSPRVMDLFVPHISFARFDGINQDEVNRYLQKNPFKDITFKIDKITMIRTGKDYITHSDGDVEVLL